MQDFRSIILSASYQCFTACSGCYNHFTPGEVSTGDVVSFFDEVRQRTGVDRITIAGGDPLVREDIASFCEGLSGAGYALRLDTVGTSLLGDAKVNFLGKHTVPQLNADELQPFIDVIGIPVDGHDELSHVSFRRFGSLDEQLRILDLLSTAGYSVCVNTVVNQHNHDNLAELFELIKPFSVHKGGGISQWQLFQFMPIGKRGNGNRDRFEITPEQYLAACSSVPKDTAGIELGIKGMGTRKHRYLLVTTDGTIWYPKQVDGRTWYPQDASPHRVEIGNITDIDGVDKFVAALQRKSISNMPAGDLQSSPFPGATIDTPMPPIRRGLVSAEI